MIRTGSGLFRLLAAACVLLPAAAGSAFAVDPFNVYVDPALPDTVFALLNTTFNIYLDVDSTAKEFNGFDVTLQFRPSVVSLQSSSEGPLFPGLCPNRFTPTSNTDSTATFGDFLLCNGISANGPGSLVIYTFTALAPGVSPVTITSDPNRSFYDAGLYIWPQNPVYPRQVIFHNAVVKVLGPGAGAPESGKASADRPRVWIAPDPIRDAGEIHALFPALAAPDRTIGAGRSWATSGCLPVELMILDSAGRLITRWSEGAAGPGLLVVPWRPVGSGGQCLAAGVYFCVLEHGGETAITRFVVVR